VGNLGIAGTFCFRFAILFLGLRITGAGGLCAPVILGATCGEPWDFIGHLLRHQYTKIGRTP
jgi:hypothetical protein